MKRKAGPKKATKGKFTKGAKDKDKKIKKLAKGGMAKKKGYAAGGALQKTTSSQKGLKKLPTSVRNKMGFMSKCGMASKKGKK